MYEDQRGPIRKAMTNAVEKLDRCFGKKELKVRREEITFINMPITFDRYRVLQISDLHSRCFGENQRDLLQAIRREVPEMIFLTGDLIDKEYNEEEKITFYKALLAGDEKAIEPISMFSLRNVLKIADKYMEPKLLVEDLVQEGNVALFLKLSELCGCRQSYDVEQELENAIEEAIVAYASEMSNEREQESTLVGKLSLVHEAKKLLAEENGTEPTIAELAAYTKMDEEELQELEDLIKRNNK